MKLWKSADGPELPEIDREVVAITKSGLITAAHRPVKSWQGKDLATGKVETFYPKRFGKGQWNQPDLLYWLDIEIPEIE